MKQIPFCAVDSKYGTPYDYNMNKKEFIDYDFLLFLEVTLNNLCLAPRNKVLFSILGFRVEKRGIR